MTFYGGVFLIRMDQEKQYEAPGYMTYREAALMFSLMPESDAAKAIKATTIIFTDRCRAGLMALQRRSSRSCVRISTATMPSIRKSVNETPRTSINDGGERDTSRIPLVNQSNTNYKP